MRFQHPHRMFSDALSYDSPMDFRAVSEFFPEILRKPRVEWHAYRALHAHYTPLRFGSSNHARSLSVGPWSSVGRHRLHRECRNSAVGAISNRPVSGPRDARWALRRAPLPGIPHYMKPTARPDEITGQARIARAAKALQQRAQRAQRLN